MQKAKVTPPAGNVEIFWNKYLEILSRLGIKEGARQWYVKRAEAFVRAARGKKLLNNGVRSCNQTFSLGCLIFV